MNERKVLKATEGMVLTNGVDFGREVYLAEGVDESSWYEITKEEFEAISGGDDKEHEVM